MSRIKLDLKQFKYHSSNDKSTTLKHQKDGHLLTIAHNTMSPENRDVLKSLSKIPEQDETQDQKDEGSSDYGKVTVKEPDQKTDSASPYGKVIQKAQGGTIPSMDVAAASKGGQAKTASRTPMADGGGPAALEDMENYIHQKAGMPITQAWRKIGGSTEASVAEMTSSLYNMLKSQENKQGTSPTTNDSLSQTTQKPYTPPQVQKMPTQSEEDSKGAALAQAPEAAAALNNKLNAQGAAPQGDQPTDIDPSQYQQYNQPQAQGNGSGGPSIPIDPSQYSKWQPEAKGGQIRKKYAEAGKVTKAERPENEEPSSEPNIESAEQAVDPQNYAPQQPEQQAQVPKQLADTQKMYNSLVSGNGGGPTTPSNSQFNPNGPGQYAKFGPNGEPPQAFDANKYAQAEDMLQQQQASASGASTQRTAQIQLDNQVRQRAGLPPLPTPGQGEELQQQAADQDEQNSTIPQEGSVAPDQDPTAPGTAPTPPAQPYGGVSQDPSTLLNRGGNNALQGIAGKAAAEGAIANRQANDYNYSLQNRVEAEQRFTKKYNDLIAERQNHITDIQNGYIDPEQYWKGDPKTGEGGHSKVMAAIGMILGGFNPTNRPNGGVEMLKYQIDKNIEAQKTNLGAKQNLLMANLHQFENAKEAAMMSRMQLTDQVSDQLNKSAAMSGSQLAQSAGKMAAGQLQMGLEPEMKQLAMMRAMRGLAGGGPRNEGVYNETLGMMRMVNPEYAKQLASQMVPGVGVSQSQSIPEDVRAQLIEKQNLDVAAKDLLSYMSQHTNINPLSAEYKVGETKAFNLKQMYRKAQLGGILRQGEMPMLDKILDANPANVFKELNSVPKLKEMVNLNSMSKNVLMKNYGIIPWNAQQQAAQQSQQQNQGANQIQQALQWAKDPKNAKDPRSAQILKRLSGN